MHKGCSCLRLAGAIAAAVAFASLAVTAVAPAFEGDGPITGPASPPVGNARSSAASTPASAIDPTVSRWTARTVGRPNDVDAWAGLGDAWMQRSRDRTDPDLTDHAEVAYRRALDLDSRHVPALTGMAWAANTRHDFDDGRRWANKALEIDPRAVDALALLGDAAVELGEYDEGFERYQAAIDIRPDLSTYSRSAHLLWLTGDSRRAMALMRKAILAGGPHAENTGWCRAELALMLFNDGALLPARMEVEAALRNAPDRPHLLAVLGRIRMAQKDYPGAIEVYEKAVALSPGHVALAALTELYALAGNRPKSEAMFQRVLEFHSRHTHRHAAPPDAPATPVADHSHGDAELARFLADQDRDLDRALKEAESAYATFKNVYVTDTLAWCYYKKGRDADAARTIRRALRWKTPDAMLLYHAGLIHDRIGDRPSARKFLYQALSLNPHFHPTHAAIAADTLKRLAASPTPDSADRATPRNAGP